MESLSNHLYPFMFSLSGVGGLVAKSCPTLCNSMDPWPARVLCPWDSPGKNTGVGCHFLLHFLKCLNVNCLADTILQQVVDGSNNR